MIPADRYYVAHDDTLNLSLVCGACDEIIAEYGDGDELEPYLETMLADAMRHEEDHP